MVIHFANWHWLYFFAPLFVIVLFIRWKLHKSPTYTHPLSSQLDNAMPKSTAWYPRIFAFLRFVTLASLLFLVLRPQWVDQDSKVNVQGIDIILAIDVSQSMILFDDVNDQRPRIDVAKSEAIRFIEKRTDDPIGIIIFGKEAISRCPLTLDKNMLKELVGQMEIGIINPNGTWLGTGLATAINRLKTSKAKSKVIILLTDGAPTPPEKVEPDVAIEMAKAFGIKVYTIGIGGPHGGLIHDQFSIVQVPIGLNTDLLKKIADQTGGQFFQAKNPKDMRTIYDTIDRLEKTKHETNIFHHFYEAFLSFIWITLCALLLELILKLFIWRGVW